MANYFIWKALPFDEISSEQKFPSVSSFVYIIHLRRNVSSQSDGGNSSLTHSSCRSRGWEMLRNETELEITPQLCPRFVLHNTKSLLLHCVVSTLILPSLKAQNLFLPLKSGWKFCWFSGRTKPTILPTNTHWDYLPYWQFKRIAQKTDYSDFLKWKVFKRVHSWII